MPTITFHFTVEETNLILEALGQLPFNQVYQLIGKIQNEASDQLHSPSLKQPPAPNLSAVDQTTVSKSMEVNGHDQ